MPRRSWCYLGRRATANGFVSPSQGRSSTCFTWSNLNQSLGCWLGPGCFIASFCAGLGLRLSLSVQVPNNHILTQHLYYNYCYPRPQYLIIGYLNPKPSTYTLYIPMYPCISPLKGPNYWVLGHSGLRPV